MEDHTGKRRALLAGLWRGFIVLLGLPMGVGGVVAGEATKLDCGVNALYALLKLEGAPASIESLDAVLPPRHPEGYSMAELATAAGALGLRVDGVRFTKGDEPLDRPAIALLKNERGGHFLVLRPVGSTGTMVQLIDPPHAPWIADLDKVLSGPNWTGRILVPRERWPLRRAVPWISAVAGIVLLAVGVMRRRRPCALPSYKG